jgi:hypothetical protein
MFKSVASVVNKLPPLVVREGENYSRGAKYVDVCKSFSTDKNTDQKFFIQYADMSYLN